MELKSDKLKFWAEKNYNVLFTGKHGVGKSAIVIQTFKELGLKWLYFSGSTLDPWVDFVGIPREVQDENGKSYIELVRPKHFRDDEIEAIFIDEYNRSHEKVRNAVMELIQFKSINGAKFNKLRFIWAAVNPKSDETFNYDVKEIDPAQKDRFHIHVDVPYKPSLAYFKQTWGSERGAAAIEWWDKLNNEAKDKVSPRRLDYAVKVFNDDGDICDVLDPSTNPVKLKTLLSQGPIEKKMLELMDASATEAATKFLANENNYSAAVTEIVKPRFRRFFLQLLSKEKLHSLLADTTIAKGILNFVVQEGASNQKFADVIEDYSAKNKDNAARVTAIIKDDKELTDFYVNKKRTVYQWGSKHVPGQYKSVDKTKTGVTVEQLTELCVQMEAETQSFQRGDILIGLSHNFPVLIEGNIKLVERLVNRYIEVTPLSTLKKYAPIVSIMNAMIEYYTSTQLKWAEILILLRASYPTMIRKLEQSLVCEHIKI